MENLIKKLQEEVGISEEQATKAISVIKGFMSKEGIDIDWGSFLKGKYEELSDSGKSFLNDLAHKARDLGNKLTDKAEDLTTDAKRTARDAGNKVSDKMDE